MTNHIYTLGPDPYGDGGGLAEWGERMGKFPDVETALRGILMGHAFPVVLTGRFCSVFFPGVSLAAPAHEVIQVWANTPEALANLDAYDKAFPEATPGYWPHIGDGTNVGLLMELHIRSIADYQAPVLAGMITDGSGQPAHASPAGRFALSFSAGNRNALQVRLLQSQLAGIGLSLRARETEAAMQNKAGMLREGMNMVNAYCNGVHSLETLGRGERAPAGDPYHIFQSKVYLEEELGLIANLISMDHRDMAAIDAWLMGEFRWKKLLPYEKCILVTRICRDRRSYGSMDAFEAAYHNHFNMESLVWIRDGGMVWRFATDINFEERIFPTGDDASQLTQRIQETIWKRNWKGERAEAAARWNRDRGVVEEPVDPTTSEEPVKVLWKSDVAFPELNQFLDSEYYSTELDMYLRRRSAEAVRANAREMMPFALLLQGLIDLRGLLSIPPGTDLFDPEQQHRFIRLVNDFSHGLVDNRNADQFALRTRLDALKPGDRIIAWRWEIYSDKYDKDARWNRGKRGEGPFIFTVDRVEPQDSPARISGSLFVREFTLTRRWVKSPFTKQVSAADIHTSEWLPLDLPLVLAERLLDDRSWKRAHTWAVPILAQWKEIRAQIPASLTEETPIPLRLSKKASE